LRRRNSLVIPWDFTSGLNENARLRFTFRPKVSTGISVT